MVAVPGLAEYKSAELERARSFSPAFARYEKMLSGNAENEIHILRHQTWLECVLATYFETATTEAICGAWSGTADAILKKVWSECGLDSTESLLCALGKHGAEELNLSSDIDVMIVAEGKDALAVEKGLRRFQQRITQPGEYGFCFRLDFDLRPGGKMGPMITTPSQFQDYYWSQGETWERLALVRFRPVTGSERLAAQTSDLASRFSYRKFLDFTLLDDLKALRSQIHHSGFERKKDELHLKLEVGGIRDVELFVHSLLVMNGGKLPDLRTRSTSGALGRLKAAHLLAPKEADYLLDTYWYYRRLENIVQSFEDRQTHSLLSRPTVHKMLPDAGEVRSRMQAVDKVVSALLGQVDLESVRLPAGEPAQKAWLAQLGFSAKAIEANWETLISATALSHKNDRDERARQEFLFRFVNELAGNRNLDRDLGLSLLVDFVRATRAKATFFSMLLRTPRLIQDLARLFCLSPYLGSIVSSRPELLDHFILQTDEAWVKDPEALLQQMTDRKLLTELWSANQYLADKDLPAMFQRVSATADSIGRQLLVQLKSEFPASNIDIITLGKWGGRELGLRSDLDFIFVTPGAPGESDFKVARRFISRLTDPARGGSLYEVDLRLRPSGQSGPLLVAVDKLVEYWESSAKAWERQAYLRARPLREGLKVPKEKLWNKGLSGEETAELKDIRTKLLKPAGPDALSIKYAPGGLLDIEFVAQTAILADRVSCPATSTLGMIDVLADSSGKWKTAGGKLREIYLELRQWEQLSQLSSMHSVSELKKSGEIFAKTASLIGAAPEDGWNSLSEILEESRRHLNDLDPTGLRISK